MTSPVACLYKSSILSEPARKICHGFVKVRPVIDEIKSTGVSTLMGIADCLNRRGIPTRTGKPIWFASTVKTVVGDAALKRHAASLWFNPLFRRIQSRFKKGYSLRVFS